MARSFLHLLVSVAFVTIGVLNTTLAVLAFLLSEGIPESLLAPVAMMLVDGLLFLVGGYGLARGTSWGYYTSLIVTVFGMVGSALFSQFLSLLFYSCMFVLLVAGAGLSGVRKPAIATPPPKAAIYVPMGRQGRFVRRKRF